MLFNPTLRNSRFSFNKNSLYNNLVRAYRFSEDSSLYTVRDCLGSGKDLMPNNTTTVSGAMVFNGNGNSYAAAEATDLNLGTDESFTFMLYVKPTAVSGTRVILTKGIIAVSSSGCEYTLYHSGSDLILRVYNSTTFGEVRLNGSLTAGNFDCFIFGYDNAAKVLTAKKNNGILTSSSWTGGTQTNKGSLVFGSAPNYYTNSLAFNGEVKFFYFWKGRYLTATEQQQLFLSGFTHAALSNVSKTVDINTLPNRIVRYKPTDTSKLFQDDAKTIPATSNNDPVKKMEDFWGSSSRDATAPNNTVRPIVQTATLNGLPTIYADGLVTEMGMPDFQTARTEFTMFVVFKNLWNGVNNPPTDKLGSHILSNSVDDSYLVQVGYNYLSKEGFAAAHLTQPSFTSALNTDKINNNLGWNIFEMFGTVDKFYLLENGDAPIVNFSSWDMYNPNPVTFNHIFKCIAAYGTDLMAKGYLADIFFIEKNFSCIDRGRIRKSLDAEYGTNSDYKGY
jgi:hypothetical protein